MNDGLIYAIAKYIVDGLNSFNIVELFKWFGKRINPEKSNPSKSRMFQRLFVDIFIIIKWIFIIVIWKFHWTGLILTIIVWYLILFNMHAYFYNHAWSDDALTAKYLDRHRVRRRFLNLFLALGFSHLCFAYLYRLPYASHFSWNGIPTSVHAIWFSISNSLAANYNVVQPITDPGNTVAMIQLLISFVFITIIISRAIETPTEI